MKLTFSWVQKLPCALNSSMQQITQKILFLSNQMFFFMYTLKAAGEELDGPAVSALRHAVAEDKQSWSGIGWVT
jgi:hypothetical protein